MKDQLEAKLDWQVDKEAFGRQIKKFIKAAREGGKVIPLPVSPSLETLLMMLSQVDCSNCEALCCKRGMPGNVVALAPGEHKALAVKYGDQGFTTTPPAGAISMPCRFLLHNRCSIYPERPLSCMVFPMQPGGRVSSETNEAKIDALAVASSCPEGRRIAKALYKMTWQLKQKYFSLPTKECLAVLEGRL